MSTAAVTPAAPAATTALAARRRRGRVRLLAMAILVAIAGVAALCIGPVAIDPPTVLRAMIAGLGGTEPANTAEVIVWTTRAPRVAMAIVAGALLAVAGTVFQAMVRNGLADPYLLGINAGASTGAAVVVLVVGGGSALLFSAGALTGAVLAVLLVLALSGVASTRGPLRIILAGLAVGYALNAATNFLIFSSDSPEAARSVLFWLLGSLAAVQPAGLAATALATVLLFAWLLATAPTVDALASGDDSARSVGVDPERTRLLLLTVTSAAVGVGVAAVGGIGFVGLVVPHLARALVGSRHRSTLPAAALLGALLLVGADTVARTALAPMEIPVGVITGIVGAPALLLLLRQASARSSRPGRARLAPHPKGPTR